MDTPGETKRIALSTTWDPPGTNWFFYPLMGRWLQNDVTYASAKYKWEVPTWLHRGMLEGKDLDTWLHNLKRKKVDYVFAQRPFGPELGWMRKQRDAFQLVFWDQRCAIFKYNGSVVSHSSESQ